MLEEANYRKVLRKLDLILSLGEIENSKEGLLQATLDTNETISEIPHFQHYGFSSFPEAGSTGVFVSNGSRNSMACLGEQGPEQHLGKGQTRIYSGKNAKITLDPSGKISIEADQLELRIQGSNPLLSLVAAMEYLANSPIIAPNGSGKIEPLAKFWEHIQEVKSCVA